MINPHARQQTIRSMSLLCLFSAVLIAPKSMACDIYSMLNGSDNEVKLVRASINSPTPRSFTERTNPFPQNYSGIDPYLAWKVLRKSQLPKQEFETTPQYESRKNLQSPYAIKYGYTTKHTLPFVTEFTEFSTNMEIKYDADSNILKLRLEPEAWGAGHYEIVVQSNMVRGSYTGSNAFGVTRNVTRILGCEVAIRFPQPLQESRPLGDQRISKSDDALPMWQRISKSEDSLPMWQRISKSDDSPPIWPSPDPNRSRGITVEIPSSPDQARLIKSEKLTLVFLFRPVEPFVLDDRIIYQAATINDPTSISVTRHIITGELKGLFVLNSKNKKVIGSTVFD